MLAIPPLAAEPIFYISNFPITNTFINAALAMLLIVFFAIVLQVALRRQGTEQAPRGIVNFTEGLLETLFGYFDQVTNDRKKTIQFLPIVGSLFFFILISNWAGLLPGISSITRTILFHGHVEAAPVFRPANTDLNLTIAMGVLAVAASHIIGIATIGFFKYANKFIKLGDIWYAVKSMSPKHIMTAIIEFFVGILEIFSEVAKMVSLSLRLFGNVFAGEVLLTVLAGLIAVFLPVPFMALELIVGLVQATVFAMLTLVYLTVATTPVPDHATAAH